MKLVAGYQLPGLRCKTEIVFRVAFWINIAVSTGHSYACGALRTTTGFPNIGFA
jgi:hypothetical protein